MHKARGFTLIELLVVIAIIGFLAAIVLAAVGSARNKGVDAAVKGNLGSIRSEAEIYSSNNGNSYSGVCPTLQAGTGVKTILNNAASTTQSNVDVTFTDGGAWNQVTCHDSTTAWVVEAPLKASVSGTPSMWCVDSSGNAKGETTNMSGSATTCP